MRIPLLTTTLALGVAFAGPALADAPAFVGPSGWSTVQSTPTDPAHPLLQWHIAGDSTTSLTYIRTTQSYDDSLGAIRTNLSTNKIKPAIDKDMPCQGKTAHVVEFAAGPDEHKIVINRLLVPQPDGVAAITYAHADGTPFDPDVKKAETVYCASSST